MRAPIIALALPLLTTVVQARDGFQWGHGDLGRDRSSIMYAVPESDNIWVSGSCIRKNVVRVMFSIRPKAVTKVSPDTDNYLATIRVGGEPYRLIGKLEADEINDGHVFIAMITPDDRLLQRMAADSKSSFRYDNATIPLDMKSASGFKGMLKVCT
ncbi:MAG: hypothetical protein J0J10_20085 [Bosea sp.]|uniref:hypothetical protein n=1 Tax=Bosea sp. (in: a-proteobacteria) TaxID=1871050 RepID=UPI001ACBAF99|nr:hypothetical protein [Bosea sp. (in: a-proteobacteria)]MBN9471072.1 hypothetical protein [Bosea sp. (in: a-proteobacteria)]